MNKFISVLLSLAILITVGLGIVSLDPKTTTFVVESQLEVTPTATRETHTQEWEKVIYPEADEEHPMTEEHPKKLGDDAQTSLFDKEIVFQLEEHFHDEGLMPYVLMKPVDIDDRGPAALIIWMHGKGENSQYNKELFKQVLPTELMMRWELENFNAIFVCPQLMGKSSEWFLGGAPYNVEKLLNHIIQSYNVDEDKIIVAGTSSGGVGALWYAVEMTEYFDKAVIFNGHRYTYDQIEVKIPTIGYVGTVEAGEMYCFVNYMNNEFVSLVGEERLFTVEASHAGLPKEVFAMDTDKNGRSDVIEWMLSDENIISDTILKRLVQNGAIPKPVRKSDVDGIIMAE